MSSKYKSGVLLSYWGGKILFMVSLFLILGLLDITHLDFTNYLEILQNESREWNKSPIIDIFAVPQKEMCPPGDLVAGVFPGTNSYCSLYYGEARIAKSCNKGESHHVGMHPIPFEKFNEQYLCFKRDLTMNYHKLVQLRASSEKC
jgi:hypothetical protein